MENNQSETTEFIKKLLSQGESHNLEFKSSLILRNEIGETISAFANTAGGTVLLGVSDRGEVIGIDIGKKTLEDFANFVKENTDPQIYPALKVHKINGKSIIEVFIKESDEKPVFFKTHGFQRVGKTNQKISAQKIRELAKQEKKKLRWDEQICEGTSLKEIDEEKVKWFLRKAKSERGLEVDSDTSIKEALKRLELIKDEHLTNAAVLLFGRNPQSFFLQAETRCGRFKGKEATKPFIDMKVFGGNIIDQVNEAEQFVLRNTSMAAWLEAGKVERQEKWEYPPDAIREAIVNAICHRDYRETSNVQVRIFDDRLEVWGCGLLLKPLTIEKLKVEHKSILRNPLIGRCFFLIKFIEQWGTGTNEIINMCLDWGLPEPVFKTITGSLVVVFRKYHFPENLEGLDLSERQSKAINFLKEHRKINNEEYRKINDVSRNTATNDLTELVKRQIIKQIGKGRGSYYKFV